MSEDIELVRVQGDLRRRERLRKEKPAVYDKVVRYKEKVSRGESIALITLNYDYLCNFNCEHCCADGFMIKDPEARKADTRKVLTPESVRLLCNEGDELGLANIVISGGETLTYRDFDQVVEAIDPSRWHIATDTNGWLLDKKKAAHLKSIGVDKVQISLDSAIPAEHDRFRKRPGSFDRVIRALDAVQEVGLDVILLTVMWKDRVRSEEFISFLEFAKSRGIGTYVTYAKPVGAWEGNYDVLCGYEDFKYIESLETRYELFTRMTPGYGIDLGCISVKRGITITKYGDVMPCPYIYTSLGNIFSESLKEILNRGLLIKHFAYGMKHTCLSGNKDDTFIKDYMSKMHGKQLPVPYDQIFTAEDFVDGKMH